MKSSILFRHGKSNWYANYSKDINRPLNERGIKSAKLIFLSTNLGIHPVENVHMDRTAQCLVKT